MSNPDLPSSTPILSEPTPKKIHEIYPNDLVVIDGTKNDLRQARKLMQKWINNEPIDPHESYYIGMLCLSMARSMGMDINAPPREVLSAARPNL